MTTLLNTAIGGLLAAVLAAVLVHFAVARTRPGDRGLDRHRLWGRSGRLAFVWISYGAVAAMALFLLDAWVFGVWSVPPTAVEAIGLAVAWSALLGGILVAIDPDIVKDGDGQVRRVELLAYHLVYGVGLGVWIRLTWIT